MLEDFIVWCKRSFLNINISKSKEMIIDFRRKSPSVPPSLIDGQAVEVVHQYKYLMPTLMPYVQRPTNACTFTVN